MKTDILMPKLGLTMQSGQVAKWLKSDGDFVSEGEELFDVETDKLTNTIESRGEGYLKIIVEEGIDVEPSAVIGQLFSSKEDIDSGDIGTDTVEEVREESVVKDTPTQSSDSSKVCVIGAGPGGYVSAIKLAQLGKEVVLVEEENIGGTCLNVGCIPTKALLESASLLNELDRRAELGIEISGEINFDWNKILENKENIVSQLVQGTEGLLKANKVEIIKGRGKVIGSGKVEVVSEGESTILEVESIILATGSRPLIPNIPGVNSERVIDSTDALNLEELPKELVIVGGGVIGIELAYLLNSFGVKVVVLEMMDRILPMVDKDISENVKLVLESQGIEIINNAEVKEINDTSSGVEVNYLKDGKEILVSGDKVLLSIGRSPNLEDVVASNLNLKLDGRYVDVDKKMRTNIDGLYAIGDITGKNLLAHVAYRQGVIAANNIAGNSLEMDYKAVPAGIFITPEVASVGITEDEAKEKGLNYKIGTFNMMGNAKAKIAGQDEGTLVKLIVGEKHKEILGAHIFGPNATELIHELTLAIELEATVDELNNMIHSHPTVSESIQEASFAVDNIRIHGLN